MAEQKKQIKKPLSLFERLSEPLPGQAIQRTKGTETKKGYDTTGFGYQYEVNRFNEVMGVGGWNWSYKIVKEQEGQFRSGGKFTDITVEATITLYIDGKEISHTEPGGHRSGNYADALKGASTNALKKTAGFFGVGKQAFEGSIDDDNVNRGGYDKDVKKLEPVEKSNHQLALEAIVINNDPFVLAEVKGKIPNSPLYTPSQKKDLIKKIDEKLKKV